MPMLILKGNNVSTPSMPFAFKTWAEYQALSNEQKMNGTVYCITDRNEYLPDAEHVPYDHTASGLQAEDVQGAIDEINTNLSGKQGSLDYSHKTAVLGGVQPTSYTATSDGVYNLTEILFVDIADFLVYINGCRVMYVSNTFGGNSRIGGGAQFPIKAGDQVTFQITTSARVLVTSYFIPYA